MGFFSGGGGGSTVDLTSPGPIGSSTPSTGAFTTLSASTSLQISTSGYLFGGTNLIEQRNSTSAQSFQFYNTYTDASNYERAFMRWSTNVLQIGTEAAGTGTLRQVSLPLGTITASTPLSITQTWNNAAVGFTGILANITNTASTAASYIMDLQVNGTSMMNVSKTGVLTLNSGGSFQVNGGGSIFRGLSIGVDGLRGSSPATPAFLFWPSNNLIEQRNSTNAQTYLLYRTYTDASNYERLGILSTNTTRYTITSQNAGTGSARSLEASFYTSASDPTSSDITSGCFSVWKNSGSGTVKLWVNDGGTMKSVALA